MLSTVMSLAQSFMDFYALTSKSLHASSAIHHLTHKKAVMFVTLVLFCPSPSQTPPVEEEQQQQQAHPLRPSLQQSGGISLAMSAARSIATRTCCCRRGAAAAGTSTPSFPATEREILVGHVSGPIDRDSHVLLGCQWEFPPITPNLDPPVEEEQQQQAHPLSSSLQQSGGFFGHVTLAMSVARSIVIRTCSWSGQERPRCTGVKFTGRHGRLLDSGFDFLSLLGRIVLENHRVSCRAPRAKIRERVTAVPSEEPRGLHHEVREDESVRALLVLANRNAFTMEMPPLDEEF
ncbi:unnamed protein product [Darwinula stevensoni]|uniref:Uncharacterized protein n=1 Tax=Darwinula stevensoni TaxID=69355 RepID=A0A7R9FQ49_9CRUS|nr:unnamed protein product [Darwinula stevensoni]CAG0899019.1 unnamed protein product [Darwinula stevensoni]